MFTTLQYGDKFLCCKADVCWQRNSHNVHISEHYSSVLFAKMAEGLDNGLSCAAHLQQQDQLIVRTMREAL